MQEIKKSNLVICKRSTRDNLLLEMRQINPWIEQDLAKAERFANLWTLYRNLDLSDCGIKQLAHRMDLMDFVGWRTK